MKGIGTLNEKGVHSFLKKYLENDEGKHEIRAFGYIADIVNQDGITEIQSKNFGGITKKIETYLLNGVKTRIVYPVSVVNVIYWLDPITHDISEIRKSTSSGYLLKVFKELYQLGDMLKNPNLTISIVALKTDDYRNLDGYGQSRKYRSTKLNKEVTEVIKIIDFNIECGYGNFLPLSLPYIFTSLDYKRCTHSSISDARTALLVLTRLGFVQRVGKRGNNYLYSVVRR